MLDAGAVERKLGCASEPSGSIAIGSNADDQPRNVILPVVGPASHSWSPWVSQGAKSVLSWYCPASLPLSTPAAYVIFSVGFGTTWYLCAAAGVDAATATARAATRQRALIRAPTT